MSRAVRYRDIAENLRSRVAAGEFGAGRLLPSEAELSDVYAVSRVTVRRALELLRMKGIVNVTEMPDTPVVVHGVQHVFHPTAQLERWPDDDRRTRLVFITKDLPQRTVQELFEAFLGAAAPDRPDRAALTDNPLVPFGGSDSRA